MESVETREDVQQLRQLIEEHAAATGSAKAAAILADFTEYLPKFKKVLPRDYARMLAATREMEEKGLDAEQAKIEAFYAVQRG